MNWMGLSGSPKTTAVMDGSGFSARRTISQKFGSILTQNEETSVVEAIPHKNWTEFVPLIMQEAATKARPAVFRAAEGTVVRFFADILHPRQIHEFLKTLQLHESYTPSADFLERMELKAGMAEFADPEAALDVRFMDLVSMWELKALVKDRSIEKRASKGPASPELMEQLDFIQEMHHAIDANRANIGRLIAKVRQDLVKDLIPAA